MYSLHWLGGAVGAGTLRLLFVGFFFGLWLGLTVLAVACKSLAAKISALASHGKDPSSHLIGGI